jgi:hypothetical protein
MHTYSAADAQHDASRQCVQLVHSVDHFALEVLREVLLLSFRLRRLVQLLHEVKVLHLGALHATDLVEALGHFANFDHLVCCWKEIARVRDNRDGW